MRRRTLMTGIGAVGLYTLAGTLVSGGTKEGNQMIIVTFEVEFEDDGIHQLRDAIREMDEATVLEPGCIAYKSSFDVTNPRILRIYEMWDSMEALIPHFKTPHMATFQAALGGLVARSMDAKVYEVARELPFPN